MLPISAAQQVISLHIEDFTFKASSFLHSFEPVQ